MRMWKRVHNNYRVRRRNEWYCRRTRKSDRGPNLKTPDPPMRKYNGTNVSVEWNSGSIGMIGPHGLGYCNNGKVYWLEVKPLHRTPVIPIA